MFKTIIEFMDGAIKEYPSRHMARADISVYRLLFKNDEILIPLVSIRTIRTVILEDEMEKVGRAFDQRDKGTHGGQGP
jgi:hypothetical protein